MLGKGGMGEVYRRRSFARSAGGAPGEDRRGDGDRARVAKESGSEESPAAAPQFPQ